MPKRPSLKHLVACAVAPILLVTLAVACAEEEPECTSDDDCQEITCPDGSKMRTCDEGACLQGNDCEVESTGGW